MKITIKMAAIMPLLSLSTISFTQCYNNASGKYTGNFNSGNYNIITGNITNYSSGGGKSTIRIGNQTITGNYSGSLSGYNNHNKSRKQVSVGGINGNVTIQRFSTQTVVKISDKRYVIRKRRTQTTVDGPNGKTIVYNNLRKLSINGPELPKEVLNEIECH